MLGGSSSARTPVMNEIEGSMAAGGGVHDRQTRSSFNAADAANINTNPRANILDVVSSSISRAKGMAGLCGLRGSAAPQSRRL